MATKWNSPGGTTREALIAEEALIYADLKAGKTVMASSAGDSSLTEKVEISIRERLRLVQSDICTLDELNLTAVPTTYVRRERIAHKRARVRYT